ncbi:MAG: cytochrome c peroxidase [Planctomycetota bacterium]
MPSFRSRTWLATALTLGLLAGSAMAQGTLSGTVRNADDNSPIAGAVVTVDLDQNLSDTTGPDGTYSISGIAAGSHSVLVIGPGVFEDGAQADVDIFDGQTTTQDFDIAPEPPITTDSLSPLSDIPVPGPENIGDYIKDKKWAIILGKALFWDMQVGSDGIMACATCHFHAGADSRVKNQVNPGSPSKGYPFNTFFDLPPNYTLTEDDFPLRKLSDPTDRDSYVIRDTDDVISSQGVFKSSFNAVVDRNDEDDVNHDGDDVFQVNGCTLRRVEPRNTPTVINAVFNFRNFWDGRAKNKFNGQDPFGSESCDSPKIAMIDGSSLDFHSVDLRDSSLASQAVGPPLSDFEMSGAGRNFPLLGRKMLSLKPLNKQYVDRYDSVLGQYANAGRPGLRYTYKDLIQRAFHYQLWYSRDVIDTVGGDVKQATIIPHPGGALSDTQYTQMEYNFAFFFGLAVQCYEATLVSDDTPVDRYLRGADNALNSQQKRGFDLFLNKGKCINCHGGAEFTNASVRRVRNQPLERMIMGNDKIAVYDNGFYNIGVRETCEDIGVGGTDPWGQPLSHTRLAQEGLFNNDNLDPPIDPNERVAVMGAFKTPGLRNVDLTGPYFHNGGQATLRQVVEFYNRGGDFHDENIDDLDPDIRNLGLSEDEIDDLVAFLCALTDERVRWGKAPFDHPQIFIPHGSPGDEYGAAKNYVTGNCKDEFIESPAIGKNGYRRKLGKFLEHRF